VALRPFLFALLLLGACRKPHPSSGEELARAYCASCHAFPEPQLLDARTWENGVLPQMAPRVGVQAQSLYDEMSRSPYMPVLSKGVTAQEWGRIVDYFLTHAPESLPAQSLPAEPVLDPPIFKASPFVPRLQSTGVITLLKADSVHRRIFVGEAGSNSLRVFDWNRRLLSSVSLTSPPTDLIVDADKVLVLESGILDPNDEAKGSLVEYDFANHTSLGASRVLIDSLLRPVFVEQVDLVGKGQNDFVICEFGDNRGRLALYRFDGARYQRRVLEAGPGAIRFEVHDMNGDGFPDLVVLFAQGDERIVLFGNDGKGSFPRQRLLARFPPVYGSMFFSMHDFNRDGHLDLLYVNGDNFDYSRVPKPYHGVRILENDGNNNFRERYFFPIYGAARAEVADFDGDGDLDIFVTSNFANARTHPERGIIFLENTGHYQFKPYAFSSAAGNQWNLTATADLNGDGRPGVLVAAMNLQDIGYLQRGSAGKIASRDPILFFENRTQRAARTGSR